MSKNSFMKIAGRRIGVQYPPYVIAEVSANHNGKFDTALRIIEAAKKAGADAVKLQTYRPDTITLDCDREEFRIRGGLWDGKTLYELYEEAHMPWEWHGPLFDHARKIGITIFSSPFDNTAVDLLEELDAPAYKIASFEAIDLPLIKYVAATGKPMIISTGMADIEEIQEAIDAALDGGCRELAILRCVSGYPSPASDYNLRTIPDMTERFGLLVGLSDHTLDNSTAITSVALGTSIIEKHFTLDRSGGGPDDSFSLEPPELTALCRDVHTAWQALGEVDYGRKSSELGNAKFRRSLYFVKSLKAGELITSETVRSIRPGFGLAPKYISDVLGRVVKQDVAVGTPVNWDLLGGPDPKRQSEEGKGTASNRLWHLFRSQPMYVLMRGFARFRTMRLLVVFARQIVHVRKRRRYLAECESRMSATLFPAVDRAEFVEKLKDNGVSFELALPATIVRGIHDFAKSSTCYADRNGALGFMAENRSEADVSLGKPILLAQYFNTSKECSEISQLSNDPMLLAIACEYLGSVPTFVGANLWWTFPVNALESDRDLHAHLFHRDVDDFRFFKFFFYLTEVIPGEGGHVCVAGSHAKRVGTFLSDRWRLRRYADDEISSHFSLGEIREICGPAGTGFAENTFCIHKGLTPKTKPRLLLQLQYSLFDYGVMHDRRNSEQLQLISRVAESR